MEQILHELRAIKRQLTEVEQQLTKRRTVVRMPRRPTWDDRAWAERPRWPARAIRQIVPWTER